MDDSGAAFSATDDIIKRYGIAVADEGESPLLGIFLAGEGPPIR